MKRFLLILVLCAAAAVIVSERNPASRKPARPQRAQQLELFGVPLKSATRDQLRQTFKQNGMVVIREDKNNWVDAYDTREVLEGSSEFIAGYVDATDRFAFAAYLFFAFRDTQLVGKVISMVSVKYGPPTSRSGNYDTGPVRAEWDMGQGMGIMVCRGWPDTTTALIYRDAAAYRQMRAEIDSEEKAPGRQGAKPREKAF